MTRDAPGVLKPALIGGAVFGFLGGAPVVSILNCLCCALILGAGFLAAFIQANEAKSRGLPYTPSNGAVVGFAAGIVYGLVDTVTSSVAGLLFHEAAVEWLSRALEQVEEIPPGVLDVITGQSQLGMAASVALGLIVNLGFGILFATLGGLIGGAVFKSEPTPPRDPVELPGTDRPAE